MVQESQVTVVLNYGLGGHRIGTILCLSNYIFYYILIKTCLAVIAGVYCGVHIFSGCSQAMKIQTQ